MERPDWAEGFERVGTYYEGYVSNLDAVLERHKIATLTSYGTRTSHLKGKICLQDESAKENAPTQVPIFFACL